MLKTTYFVYDFDYTKASIGNLCVMIKADAKIEVLGGPDRISNIVVDDQGEAHNNTDFAGAGICNVKNSSAEITLNGVVYSFNLEGIGISANTTNYVLKLAEVDNQTTATGNAIQSPTTNTVRRVSPKTKGDTRSILIPAEVDYTNGSTVMVSSLNARDQFAVQALRGIMDKNKDVIGVADNEKYYYCQQAYQWADNMMKLAAQTRAVLVDETHSTEQSEIGELETNTDKLLNNILYTLEKSEETTKAQTTALVEVLTAIKEQMEAQTSALTKQTTALNNIKTAIENLELSPTINNNIIVPKSEEE